MFWDFRKLESGNVGGVLKWKQENDLYLPDLISGCHLFFL